MAPAGMIGLETALGLVKTRLIDKGFLSWPDAIKKMTVNPARILNLPYGTFATGRAADVTIIDPERRWTVNPSDSHSRSRNTPFAGWELSSKAVMTIKDGVVRFRAK